jgi:hypothetical protein
MPALAGALRALPALARLAGVPMTAAAEPVLIYLPAGFGDTVVCRE